MQAGGARLLYLGDSHATCLAESQALGLPQWAVTIVPVRVELQAVIDLRDPATLALPGDPQEEWRLNFRLRQQPTASQQLGEACARQRIVDGILYPSLVNTKGGVCLAVLEAALVAGSSRLEVNDPATGVHTLPCEAPALTETHAIRSAHGSMRHRPRVC
jgi:RES domain-containing protein